MARGASQTVDNNFTKGLITEFTAMNFPENAITEGDNCVFSEKGSVTRRLGMDYENGNTVHTLSVLTVFPNCFTEFKWHSVDSIGTTSFVVQQMGNFLRFFSVADDSALSTGLKSFAVDLNSYRSSGTTFQEVSENPCQYTSGRGYLIVVHPLCDPIYVAYDADTDSITTTRITIEARDFELLDDSLDIDERPSTLTNLHKYNLWNQGWNATTKPSGAAVQPALDYWDSRRSDFPSNADIFWVYKDVNNELNTVDVDRNYLGNTPAPNGHYIYNALNIDRTTETGITGLPTVTSGAARPSCVAFYAGRVFYAGVGANKYSDKLYFSQIVDNDDKIGKCYQKSDPTAEQTADLLDDDGGVISLPLIETVISLKVIADVLVVVATNGIYTISGTQQGPFKHNCSKVGGRNTLS